MPKPRKSRNWPSLTTAIAENTTMGRRRRRFVLEYVIDLNGRAAAKRAGFSAQAADCAALALLRRPEVKEMIREEIALREARTRITGERIMREAARIAFGDPGRVAKWGPNGVTLRDSEDMAEEDRATVKRISVGGRKGARAQRFEMHDKIAALDLLARMTGLITRTVGRGRFAIIDQERGRDQPDANTILRERLLRIARRGKEAEEGEDE